MLNLTQLNSSLTNASAQHKQLTSIFREFANFVESQVGGSQQSAALKSITTSLLQLDDGIFNATFASRTVTFVFSSIFEKTENHEGTENMVGNVHCYLEKRFPESTQIELGRFAFSKTGQTNVAIPGENRSLNIGNDIDALNMAVLFIHKSLSK